MSVRRSIASSYAAQLINFVVAFGSSVIIARLVSPREFGIFAMAASLSAFMALLFSFSLSDLIVRDESMPKTRLRSILAVSSSYTAFLCVLLLVSGMFAKHIFTSPEVGDFLLVYSIVPAVQMFELIPEALCRRHMRFNVISAISIMKTVIVAAGTILFAILGFKHMSFAYAGLLSVVASAGTYNLLYWRETVYLPHREGFQKIFTFGLQMVSINGFAQLNDRLCELFLGSWLGLATLGLYSRASNLTNQLSYNVYGLATGVIFVKMSMDFRETGQFQDVYLRALRMLLAVIWPILLGVALLSRPLINLLYGPAWLGAALPLTLLMLALFVILGIGMQRHVFVLRDETGLQTKLEAVRATTGLFMFVVGCLISLPAAAAAKFFEAIVAYYLYRPHMDRLIGVNSGQLDRVYVECLMLSLVASWPSFLLMLWFQFNPETPFLPIVVAVSLGVIGWFSLVMRLKHPLFEEMKTNYGYLLRAVSAIRGPRG
jgi:O-antigen/teichoic acid export membrane protein